MATEKAAGSPRKWAVLVGINEYLHGDSRVDENGQPLHFPNLSGCLNDIDEIEQYLLRDQSVEKNRIFTLCSPSRRDSLDTSLPTADNIMQTMEDCTYKAKPGDIVYFHYSGHGGRVKTLWPNTKDDGMDEYLAPYDVHKGGKLLRDIDLETILSKMTAKGLFVTVTLDSCHSGAFDERGYSSFLVRGIDQIAVNLETDQPMVQLHHPDPIHQRYSRWRTRGGEKGCSFLKPKKYVLLAACGPHEKSHESVVDGVHHGNFTYWLLRTIQLDSNSTYRLICDRTSIKMRNSHPQQSPIAVGEIHRYFMKSDSSSSQSSFILSEMPKHLNKGDTIKEGERATLNGGKAHGVCTEDEYDIYPWNFEGRDNSQRLAVATVTAVEEFWSTVEFTKLIPSHSRVVEAGCRAVRTKQRDRIRVTFADRGLLSEFKSALTTFEDAIFHLQPTTATTEGSIGSNTTYQVSSVVSGTYRLLSGSGENIPFLPDSTSQTKILQQAVSLGAYHIIRELKSDEPLPDEYKFRFSVDQEDTRHNDVIMFTFHNDSEHRLYTTVLNFEPLWGISKLLSTAVDPGKHHSVKIRMKVPERCRASKITDTLKCLVTLTQISFDPLITDGMDKNGMFPESRDASLMKSLLDKLSPPYRPARVVVEDEFVWTSMETKVKTQR